MVKSELSTSVSRADDFSGVITNAKDADGARTVTRVNLAEAVYQQVGLSRKNPRHLSSRFSTKSPID